MDTILESDGLENEDIAVSCIDDYRLMAFYLILY